MPPARSIMSSRPVFRRSGAFYVESRRGGGGYIRIVRANVPASQMVMHAINGVGDSIDQPTAEAFIRNLYQAGAIGQESGRLLLALMGDKALAAAPQELRPQLRASLLKTALVALASAGT